MPTARSGADRSDGPAGPVYPARYWTADEANARLPGLRELLVDLKSAAVRYRQVRTELERLAAFWGPEVDAPDNPDRGLAERLSEEGQGLDARLTQSIASLSGEGIEVKDLDAGLLDFYAQIDGATVFLCWRLGEPEVAFYHTLDGGFRSRQALPPRSARASPGTSRPPGPA